MAYHTVIVLGHDAARLLVQCCATVTQLDLYVQDSAAVAYGETCSSEKPAITATNATGQVHFEMCVSVLEFGV